MRITICLLAVSLLYLNSGCVKDTGGTSCTDQTVQSEEIVMANYATANSINVTTHSSGLLYEIINPGSGQTANAGSTVLVTYIGKLLDGTVFETKTTPVQINLAQSITGWKIGIPLLKEGGTIKLIIPSTFGFGCTGSGPIPANAVLYFEVTLVDVL